MFRFILKCSMLAVLSGGAVAAETPGVVRQYAESFAQSRTGDEKIPSGRTLSDEYAAWFFQGFIHPHGGISTKSDLMRDAYTRGQAYWRDHPSERAGMFAGYGYLPVEREGVWSRGFEVSAFMPDGGDSPAWWITTFGGVAWREVGLDQAAANHGDLRIRIIGYMSPKGRYGHLGAYEREVLVTSSVIVSGDPH